MERIMFHYSAMIIMRGLIILVIFPLFSFLVIIQREKNKNAKWYQQEHCIVYVTRLKVIIIESQNLQHHVLGNIYFYIHLFCTEEHASIDIDTNDIFLSIYTIDTSIYANMFSSAIQVNVLREIFI